MKTDKVRKKQTGEPTTNGGQFGTHTNSQPDCALSKPPVLPEAPTWENGGQQHGVNIIESPVSDREHNFWLTFDQNGGYINVNPFEFGISDPEDHDADLADRLYIGTENDRMGDSIQVQFGRGVGDGLAEDVADLTDDQVDELEGEIYEALREEFGFDIDINFGEDGDRWDDIQVLYNTNYDGASREADGRLSDTTSNIMARLEGDPIYRRVRAGEATPIIRQVLASRAPAGE